MSTPPLTLADQAAQAERLLEPAVWAYLCGGAADELTLRANLSAWQRLPLWPRVLRPLAGGHTRTTLAGHALAHPILLAPVALQQLAHPEGELASALAAAAQGAGYVLSTQSSTPLEAVAQAVRGDPGRGPLWFQLYWQADRGFNRALVQRAEAAGYEAIVLTADAPVQGVRDRERRAG
ncbi:MAG TPA: alpha-hydroxy acid oxidase, partial [Ottowia sp.]|nr:alpha-hydroxy acid oxidase [Ottowia sp.]